MFIRAAKGTGQILSETAAQFLRQCCSAALQATGVTSMRLIFLLSIHYCLVRKTSAPVHWDRARAHAQPPRALCKHWAYAPPRQSVSWCRIGQDSRKRLVLVYAIGSVSNAGAQRDALGRCGTRSCSCSPSQPEIAGG
jgi:3-oxoacyl-[acyl-carrier-protein] synthase-3